MPYGIPSARELLRFLCGVINPDDPQNSDNMIAIGLSLLTVALETGGHFFDKFPTIMEVI